ncbi:MAG: hypothetical protein KatS3mg114_1177 [Planctomycetaceae bacterium]|nr:MAG: hypothetical protein KatS3mg114_1177 [Planctomycetaceae bacterium]
MSRKNKTVPNDASVEEYLTARARGQQLPDCQELLRCLERITQQRPQMWGSSIVGFGSGRYAYKSGHLGVAPLG